MLPTLVYLVGRFNHGVRRELQRRLAPPELSVSELSALSALLHPPGVSSAQLARQSLISAPEMNDVISRLERRGLIQRRIDPALGRRVLSGLTPAGHGVLRRVTPIVEAVETELLQDVPEPEREIVLRGLAAAVRRLAWIETAS